MMLKLKRNMSISVVTPLVIFITMILFSCGSDADYFTMADFDRVLKIDMHVHFKTESDAFIKQAVEDNFKLFTINVNSPGSPPIEKQREIAIKAYQSYPDRVAYATTFTLNDWEQPDWQQNTISYLEESFKQGAVAVKVWKNIGMVHRDAEGKLIMIDDAKFNKIFSFIQTRGKVVVGHLGEPKNCWLPLDEMTVKNDRSYFERHPEYHMYLHPELPSYQDQIDARNRMLDKNPDLIFIGAHMASLEWSVDKMGEFLQQYPKAMLETAARMGQIQYQSQRDREKVRQFFIRYQDRILYATDYTLSDKSDTQEFKKDIHERWLNDWKYFVTSEMVTVDELDKPVQGLKLPQNVIEKIYHENAENIFPDAWQK